MTIRTYGFQDYIAAAQAVAAPQSDFNAGSVHFERTAGIDGFSASFARQNLMTNLFDYVGEWINPDENPEKIKHLGNWLKENLDEEEYALIKPWYDKGTFNNVVTVGQAEFKVRRLIQESNRALAEDNAHWTTALLGGALGAIVDPTTLIPMGWFAKAGSIAARSSMAASMIKGIGRGAAYKNAAQAALVARRAAFNAKNELAKGGIIKGGLWSRQAAEWATVTSVIEGGRELGLSHLEITRTLEESLMNTGAAFIFGGMLGGLFGRTMRGNAGTKANRLDPDHPESVALYAHDTTGAVHDGVEGRMVGAADEVTEAVEGVPSSVDTKALIDAHGGAAAVGRAFREAEEASDLIEAGFDPKIVELWRKAYGGDAGARAHVRGFNEGDLVLPGLLARTPGTKHVGQFVKYTTRELTGAPWVTPLGAMRNAISPVLRKYLHLSYDNGGVATADELKGIVGEVAAENLMELGMFRGFTQTMNVIYGPLVKEWGDIMDNFVKANPGAKTNFSTEELQDVIRGVLHSSEEFKAGVSAGEWTPLWRGDSAAAKRFFNGVVKRTGSDEETVKKLFQSAEKNMQDFARWRVETMDALRNQGVVHDVRRAQQFRDEMKRLKNEIKEKEKELREAKKNNDKADTGTTVIQTRPIEDELSSLRSQREGVKKQYDQEMALPKDYGNAYGTAQMWDKNVIRERRNEFREMLIEKFSENPPEDYLNIGFGLSKEEWDKLGAGPIDIELTDLQMRLMDKPDGTAAEPFLNITEYGKVEDGVLRIGVREGADLKKDILDDFLLAPDEVIQGVPAAELGVAIDIAEAAEFDFRQLNRDVQNVKAGSTEDFGRLPEFRSKQERRVQSTYNEVEKYTRLTKEDNRWIDAFDAEEARLNGIPDAEPARPGELIPEGNTPFKIDIAEGGERAYDPRGAKTPEDDAAMAALEGKRTKRKNRGETLAKREKKLAGAILAWEKAQADLAKYADIEARYEKGAMTLRKANLTLKEAKNRVSKARRNRQTKRKGDIHDYVDAVIRHIDNEGVGDKFIKETSPFTDRIVARLRDRQLHLTPDEYLDFTEKGFLRKDVETLIHNEVRQLSGERAMNEAFGLGRQADGTMRTQADIAREIEADYDKLAAAAGDGTKENRRILAEKKRALDTWDTTRRRIRHEMHPGTNPDSWVQWMTRQMRVINFMRFVPGFMVGSFTDAAVAGAQNNGLGNLLKQGAEGLTIALPARGELGKQNLKTLAMGMEAASMWVHKSVGRTNKGDNVFSRLEAHSAQDITHSGDLGVGPAGSTIRKVTNKFADANERLSRFVARWTGMPVWNRTWRYMAGLNMMKNLNDLSQRGWNNLSTVEKRWFAKIGVDEDLAKKVVEYVRKYGTKEGDELDKADLNWDLWSVEGPEGAMVRDRFLMAMERHMNRSIIRPGYGETPAFMDEWWGKAIFQLQTFSMSFVNRVMRPMAQRAANDEAMAASMTFLHLMWTSAVVVTAKNAMAGKDVRDQSVENFLFDMVDRSGLLGAWANPINAGMKLGAPAISDLGLDFTKTRSRYSQADWFQALTGVNVGAASELLVKWPQYAANLDWKSIGRSAHRFTPFNQYTRFMLHTADYDPFER